MGTAQLDLVMLPKQFDVYYIDENGEKKMPWVIHRAVFGSFERFIGMILEHFDGQLPVWLSPIQVSVMPIGQNQLTYAQQIKEGLEKIGVRVKIDDESNTISKRIREAEIKKIPLIAVVGEKEVNENTISLRELGVKQLEVIKLDKLSEVIFNKISK